MKIVPLSFLVILLTATATAGTVFAGQAANTSASCFSMSAAAKSPTTAITVGIVQDEDSITVTMGQQKWMGIAADLANGALPLYLGRPIDRRGVARIIKQQRGIIMNANLTELNRLRELEEEVAKEFGVRADTLRRMLAKVEEYSESHRAHGLPDDLLNILKDDLFRRDTVEGTPTIH